MGILTTDFITSESTMVVLIGVPLGGITAGWGDSMEGVQSEGSGGMAAVNGCSLCMLGELIRIVRRVIKELPSAWGRVIDAHPEINNKRKIRNFVILEIYTSKRFVESMSLSTKMKLAKRQIGCIYNSKEGS